MNKPKQEPKKENTPPPVTPLKAATPKLSVTQTYADVAIGKEIEYLKKEGEKPKCQK